MQFHGDRKETKFELEAIIVLATIGDDPSWEAIDQLLEHNEVTERMFDWAKSNLDNADSNLRDLAASLIQSAKFDLDEQTVTDLHTLLLEKDPENPYPAFRAACALVEHERAWRESSPNIGGDVIAKLSEMTGDEDVREIAEEYLEKITP